MPSSISFFPSPEFIAFEPTLIPHLAKFPIRLPPCWAFFFVCLNIFLLSFWQIFVLLYKETSPFSFLCVYFSVQLFLFALLSCLMVSFFCLLSHTSLWMMYRLVSKLFVALHFVLLIHSVSPSASYSPTKNFFQ